MAASESALTGRGAQADLSMLANMPDDIGAAHQQMMRFFKLYADTIWEVQQMKQYDSQKVEALGDNLRREMDTMLERLQAVPDYAAMYGTEEKLQAKLDAVMAQRVEVEAELRQAMAVGEARLAAIDNVLASAMHRLLQQHPITSQVEAGMQLRNGGGAGLIAVRVPGTDVGGSGFAASGAAVDGAGMDMT